jgi:hypothetical protein
MIRLVKSHWIDICALLCGIAIVLLFYLKL